MRVACAKGHLISKGNFSVFNFPKKYPFQIDLHLLPYPFTIVNKCLLLVQIPNNFEPVQIVLDQSKRFIHESKSQIQYRNVIFGPVQTNLEKSDTKAC